MNVDVIRAWKDVEYRLSLTADQRASLPANPAGEIELADADLEQFVAGLGKRGRGQDNQASGTTTGGTTTGGTTTGGTTKGGTTTGGTTTSGTTRR